MYCSQRRSNSEREIDAVIDDILKKDRCGNRDTRKRRSNTKNVDQNSFRKCQDEGYKESNNGVESSARFSLRVMEAMRSLQRNNENQSLTSSNMEEIVHYIEANYHFDGDLNAQVQTVLSRISRQGFVISLGEEDYHLVGPFANYMNEKGADKILDPLYPCRGKKRSKSKKSRHEHSRRRRKKTKKTPAKNLDVPSPNNQNKSLLNNKTRGPSRKSKSDKRRKFCSSNQQYERGCPGKNIQFNEDHQSESSSSSYVTCYEDFNPKSGTNERQLYKNDAHFCGDRGPSSALNENIESISQDESSEDSIYQELKARNSKTVGSNSKDLKKWIKKCRRGCTE